MVKSILAMTTALTLGLVAANGAWAEDASTALAATDYGNPAVWLCRPGRADACS